ncbi:SOS-response transcriptional repressor LexA (RecA-mediated autopeptidase) [Marinobacterium iners DSM 11526]|uniref:SOS-response transcriptional repressor LexA (RecA-mediated autopeptidase) n=2 Tax=Marinobacterium iners TaxID=48076 RepID=A0A1H3X863_9GAMM|nr:SOS-response transcriptional repressor LexA (RecA-mediated autopeptidase) [Marinobacterium iners DSM 11526]
MTSMKLTTFGERFEYARSVLNDYTHADVARAIDVTRATIGQWAKKEQANVDALSLNKACDFLKISLSWLITGTGPIRPDSASNSKSLPVINWDDTELYIHGITPSSYAEVSASPYMPRGPRSYAVRIPTDNLIEFAKDDTIICDPDAAPSNGQYLLYKTSEGITVVSYIELTGSRKHISPLDKNATPEQYNPDNFIAVINGKWYP